MAAGTFDGPNPRLGFTRYFYDPSGQLAKLQSYRQRAGSPAQAAYVERILRDIDGNPRRIEDSIRYADPTKNAYPSQTVSAVKNPWRSRVRNFGYDNQGRVVRDKLGAPIPERRYEYDDLGRLETVTSPYRDPKTKKVSQRLVDRYGFGADDRARGAMLPLRHDSRTKVTDKLRDGRIFYGNGFTTDHYVNGKVASFAGPRGSVVLNRTRESPVDPKLVRDERYTFNRMGNLSRSTVTSYEPARRPCQIAGPLPPSPKKNVKAKTKPRASCKEEHRIGTGPRAKVRIFEGRAAAVIESEHPVYDIRSRRIGALNTVDVTAQSNEPTTDLDVFYLEANAEDPYAESTVESSPTSPYSRWIMRDDIGIVAETRQDTTRYFNTDHQGSVMQLVDGTRRGTIRATFDYDTFGTSQQDDRDTKKPDPKAAFVSGSTQERAWTAYTYTGMRLSSNGATTNHHARDYNAASRQWLQSDQYMNPWADVGLSLNSSTRDRHRYANGNPVGNTDTNGHCVGSIGWFCPLDPDPSPPSGFTPKPTPNPPFKPKPTPSNGAPGDTLITGLPGPGSTTPSTRPSAQTRIVVATSSFVSGVGANGIDAVRSSAQTMSAACATNPQGSCMAGLTQMVGSAGYDCVSSSGFGGCGGRIYGAGENYYNGCRSAMGDAYALGKGCGGDAIFALAGGMGGAKIATKGVVRSVGGRTPGGIPYTRHFEVETPAKFPDRYQPSGAEIDRVVGSPDWMATRLGNRATSYYNLDMDMTVVLGRNGVMSAHNGTPMNPNRMGMQ
jgi:hypothetical protein